MVLMGIKPESMRYWLSEDGQKRTAFDTESAGFDGHWERELRRPVSERSLYTKGCRLAMSEQGRLNGEW